jgi:branched-chain amino acid aminotransferase
VIELTGASEYPCTLDDLIRADEAFLASTVREVHPIAAIEDHEFGAHTPISDRLAADVAAHIRAELLA